MILPGDFLPGDKALEPWNLNMGAVLFSVKFLWGGTIPLPTPLPPKKLKDYCFHLHLFSQVDLKYGEDIIMLIQSLFYSLFTRLG